MGIYVLALVALLLANCQPAPTTSQRDPGTVAPPYNPNPSPLVYPQPTPYFPQPTPVTGIPSPTPLPQNGPTSNGSGGPIGFSENNFIDSNQSRGRYKIQVPADASLSKAYGLHVHFHGDGGGGYKDFPNRETRHDMIGVTVEAPMRTFLQWGRRLGKPHAQFAHELIQNELIKKYNIRTDRIYFSGVSGGAYFLTGSFIPEFGHHYNTGALVLCGGEPPRVPFSSPDVLKNFRIHWLVTQGERRDIMSDIDRSTEAYKVALQRLDPSFDITKKQTVERSGSRRDGHCIYDGRSYTTGIQQAIDQEFSTVIQPNLYQQ